MVRLVHPNGDSDGGPKPVSNLICHRNEPASVVKQRTTTTEAVNSPLMVRRSVAGSCTMEPPTFFYPHNHVRDDLWMHATQRAIDLDIAVVSVRRVADHFICAQQAAEAALIRAT